MTNLFKRLTIGVLALSMLVAPTSVFANTIQTKENQENIICNGTTRASHWHGYVTGNGVVLNKSLSYNNVWLGLLYQGDKVCYQFESAYDGTGKLFDKLLILTGGNAGKIGWVYDGYTSNYRWE